METQTFGVSFLVRKCKNDSKRADTYARITVDGEEKEFSTKEQIEASHWNRDKGMVKGTGIAVKSINNHLENIRFGIKDQYRKLLDANELITAASLKNAYLGLQTQLKGYKVKELLVKT
ncbi:Arm DNA-binding domain-containing protein [Parafilimonas sp.]|uniref:Arm DNA-binding domain-containing protein n=1 Tax=Parafilimonas sp. TaxID=1969739 RepID=UPI003F802B98